MVVKLAFLLSSLLSVPSWAQQTPTCLSPANNGGLSNQAVCCSGAGRDEEMVDGTIYRYACSHYASSVYSQPYAVANLYECAKRCSEQAACYAASWKPHSDHPTGGICYLSRAGFSENFDTSGSWLLLARTDPTGPVVGPDCTTEVEKAQEECKKESEASCTLAKQALQIQSQQNLAEQVEKTEQCEQRLHQCLHPPVEPWRQQAAALQCKQDDHTVVSTGTKRFKLRCYAFKPANTARDIGKKLTYADCMVSCQDDNSCRGFQWSPTTQGCKLFSFIRDNELIFNGNASPYWWAGVTA
ncbi:hypothetical protein ABOM_002163 [Aspergillus bombycis]|uniref:Apple domain-containing protein n=1 Tax=Aspergillus bombycis TaxID=109264 RepID=A0A1F8AA34_9EURO|nr:hypothetical protein ABOM_002163 [Aspergillus bombycis]OGM48225.1 hypothetical protein ABOM_002163 [Aspergillus bombycis]